MAIDPQVEEKVLAGESRLYCPSLCNKQTYQVHLEP